MNEWSIKRKRIIFSIVFFSLVVVVGLPILFLLYEKPTCTNFKQDGDETGIDCGGSCQLLCRAESLPLILRGDPRILTVSDNTYEVVALIENPNNNGEIYRAGYTIRLYGAQSSIPLKVIEGETHVPKGITFSIFEGPFNLEPGVVPSRATFQWKEETLIWQKNTLLVPEIMVSDIIISREDTSPRLDANIKNVTLETVSNIDLAALISDETSSVFAASKTFIDVLPPGATVPVVFTWPEAFERKAVNTNIIIRILPDKSFIR